MFLFLIVLVAADFSFESPIDNSKLRKQFKLDATVENGFIPLTHQHRRTGLITSLNTLPKSFEVNIKLSSDGVGKGFAIWLTPKQLEKGNVFGGKYTEGFCIIIPTNNGNNAVNLYGALDSVIGHCDNFNDHNEINVILKYDAKTSVLEVKINKECVITTTQQISDPYISISAESERNNGNNRIEQITMKNTRKKSKNTKEMLENKDRLPYQFTPNELFLNDDDTIENGLEKYYLMLGRVAEQAKQLEELNKDNSQTMTLIVNAVKHLNQILSKQELVIDTSNILEDVETFKDRLGSIQEITTSAGQNLKRLSTSTKRANTKTREHNSSSTEFFYWIVFVISNMIMLVVGVYLLRSKRMIESRKII
ncbi:L-type lectin-like domain-containing protein [Entamoeba marina]